MLFIICYYITDLLSLSYKFIVIVILELSEYTNSVMLGEVDIPFSVVVGDQRTLVTGWLK